jgi:hypothetical protein
MHVPSDNEEELPMRYLMFVANDPDGEQLPENTTPDWVADVDARGKRLIGDRLRPAADATTVRVRKGELLVTDGPFIESKDWIAGFDVLDCDDLDEAIEIASRHPMARAGRLELRPFWPFDQE